MLPSRRFLTLKKNAARLRNTVATTSACICDHSEQRVKIGVKRKWTRADEEIDGEREEDEG